MRFYCIFSILLLASICAFADEQKITEIMIVEDTQTSDNILDIVTLDKQPEFPGGINGLMQFLGENIIYPSECAENEIQGKVLVKFTVFKDGKVGNIEVVQSVHPLLDAEAIRVVSLLPNWKPGELNGNPVNVWYNLPVNFKLQGDDPRMAESDKFVTLGDEAMSQGNTAHAFAYYKEAFDIIPTRSYLIYKCETLLSEEPEKQEAFYKWAVARLLREAQLNWEAADDYITQMVNLQEKIVERHPNDLGALSAMEFLYFQALDFSNVKATANKLYSLIPANDVASLADAIEMDANGRYLSKDYNGVIDLVAPKVDILLTQNADTAQFGPFFELLDSYLRLNKTKEAKKLLSRLKSTYPNDFDRLISIHDDTEPELQPTVLELLK